MSWFDAVAFCRWISRRLGTEVRLPDEWEWQRAALGDSGGVYPWGGRDWDPEQEPHRANTFESRLGQATAVGMYPAGASPQGALDMAGTVWEWCLNKFDTPEVGESGDDDFDLRVLRGGSWYNDRVGARSAIRYRFNPNYRAQLSVSVWCVRPHLRTLTPERGASAPRRIFFTYSRLAGLSSPGGVRRDGSAMTPEYGREAPSCRRDPHG